MDTANNVVVTYSRVTPAPLEPPAEPLPRGPLFEAVEVPHVRADRREASGIDPVSLEGIVPDEVVAAAPRQRNRSVGRVVLLGVVALAAGVGILAATYSVAMRTAPQKGAPPASAAVGTVPPAATVSVPASAPSAATATVRPVQPGKGPDFSAATIGPQPEPRPPGSAATVVPADPAQPPAPKARPEPSAKAAAAPAPAPAMTPQAGPTAQPQPATGEFTANIERLLSRPVGDPTPPVAALPQNPVVVVPAAPPVAALPNGPVIVTADPLPLPGPQMVPPANLGAAAPPMRLVPPADIPTAPPSGTGGGFPALR